jgi:hypothetical protein
MTNYKSLKLFWKTYQGTQLIFYLFSTYIYIIYIRRNQKKIKIYQLQFIFNNMLFNERVMMAITQYTEVRMSNGHYMRVDYDTFSATYEFNHFQFQNLFTTCF